MQEAVVSSRFVPGRLIFSRFVLKFRRFVRKFVYLNLCQKLLPKCVTLTGIDYIAIKFKRPTLL